MHLNLQPIVKFSGRLRGKVAPITWSPQGSRRIGPLDELRKELRKSLASPSGCDVFKDDVQFFVGGTSDRFLR